MCSLLHAQKQRMRRLPQLLPLLVAVVAFPLLAIAQVLYGSLTGTVTDAAALAVPGATVQALNLETGVAKDATTDDRGAFAFNDLQPGTYKITVTLEGFASVAQNGVGIQANRVARVDLKLQPKAISETV